MYKIEYYSQHQDYSRNCEKYFLSVEFQKRVGIRRAELCKLCRDDFVIDESGYPCVRVKRGKGGKMQLQRILPDDIEFVKEYFDGTENRVFSSEEMKNKIDYHHMRAVQAVRAYRYYSEKICLEPGYQKKLETEIIKRWNCYNLDKNGKPKRFDKSEIYRLTASAEQFSEHPLGKAIVSCYKKE